jgi:multiple sugar transport system ATP-binding protein
MADLELVGIRKSFGAVEILHGIDLSVRNGEFCVFVGPSGCGKSTLLRLVAGLEEVTAGSIAIDARDVTDVQPAQRGIAMVFQSYALYPHMDVYENMAFGLKRARYPKAEIEQRVQRAAKTLHIENLLKRRPRDLSGGQRQRVAIGRAIVREPKLFLFDEPLSNLDAALRVEMRVELAKLKAELGATIVYVTHDQIEAMTLADRIVVMNDGRVEQCGAPLELYREPANLFVAGFIGSPKMNFVPARAVRMDGDEVIVDLLEGGTMTLPVTRPVAAGTSLTLGVRPEHLRLAGADGLVVNSEIVVAELLGGESYLHLRVPGQTMVVKTDGETTPHRGDRVAIVLPPASCHLFDADGHRISGHPQAALPSAH